MNAWGVWVSLVCVAPGFRSRRCRDAVLAAQCCCCSRAAGLPPVLSRTEIPLSHIPLTSFSSCWANIVHSPTQPLFSANTTTPLQFSSLFLYPSTHIPVFSGTFLSEEHQANITSSHSLHQGSVLIFIHYWLLVCQICIFSCVFGVVNISAI